MRFRIYEYSKAKMEFLLKNKKKLKKHYLNLILPLRISRITKKKTKKLYFYVNIDSGLVNSNMGTKTGPTLKIITTEDQVDR